MGATTPTHTASPSVASHHAAEGQAATPEGQATTKQQIVLIRHAETEWSVSGKHTGRTDLPLTEQGREAARRLAPRIAALRFDTVLTSPLRRARETCELCGLATVARADDDLLEWDYGDYEGLSTPEIQAIEPSWQLWRDGCPKGESAADVGARADAVIARIVKGPGDVAIFAHGHLLRVLAARWTEASPAFGARLALSTGAVCVLGYEHAARVLTRWNETGRDVRVDRDAAGRTEAGHSDNRAQAS